MRVLTLGIDGYLGWSFAKHLGHAKPDYELAGVDCYHRRDWVSSVGGQSITPIRKMTDRLSAYVERYGKPIRYWRGDICDYGFLCNVIRTFKPDAVVHLAEQPSAPYSMMSVETAVETHNNNLNGTLNLLHVLRDYAPDCNLIKLGSMGEYGVPNTDIPEGMFELEFRGRKTTAMFPRRAGSLYHLTKVHDTNNVEFACRAWGLRSIDIMQGVVYGIRVDGEDTWDERLCTRFDVDAVFGTAIHRFCAQAVVGEPITVYGTGKHKRAFLPLRDAMRCITIGIENPPIAGKYMTWNQFDSAHTMNDLANMVASVYSDMMNKEVPIAHLENPREGGEVADEHYYNPDRDILPSFGYEPSGDLKQDVTSMLKDLMRYKDRIKARRYVLLPDVRWDGSREVTKVID